MDKRIWLKVIKEELILLDELATGMIDDQHLSKEEVELAVVRAGIVVKEFELLLNQIPAPELAGKPADQDNIAEAPAMEAVPASVPEPQTSLPASDPVPEEPSVIPPVHHPYIPQNPSPEVSVLPGEQIHVSHETAAQRPASPGLVPPQTILAASEAEIPNGVAETVAPAESEDPNLMNLCERKEDNPHFRASPLKSLKEGIGLNDRFLFQKELFNNDKDLLDEVVASIDKLSHIQEAVAYLKAHFRWTKSEASEKFVLLVKRRFS